MDLYSGSGTTTLPDRSGNANNGGMYNFASSDWVKGKYGKALNLMAMITLLACIALILQVSLMAIWALVEAWIKVKSAGEWTDGTLRYIFSIVPNNTDRLDICKSANSNKMHIYYRTNGSDYLYDNGDLSVTPTTDWFHVA